MNTPLLQFSLLALLLLLIPLLVAGLISGAPGVFFASFAPVLVWAVVLAVRGRD